MAIGQATRAYAHASFSSGMVAASQADATIRVSPVPCTPGEGREIARLDNAPDIRPPIPIGPLNHLLAAKQQHQHEKTPNNYMPRTRQPC